IIAAGFGEYRWAEWAERFPVLDAPIENIFHVLAPGVGENAAAAQRPRSELHTALEPSHNAAIRKGSRGAVNESNFIEFAVFHAGRVQRASDRQVAVLGPEIDMPHHKGARLIE